MRLPGDGKRDGDIGTRMDMREIKTGGETKTLESGQRKGNEQGHYMYISGFSTAFSSKATCL